MNPAPGLSGLSSIAGRGFWLVVLSVLVACGTPRRGTLSSSTPTLCGEVTSASDRASIGGMVPRSGTQDAVDWLRPRSAEARAELAPWCRGVAPPLLYRPEVPTSSTVAGDGGADGDPAGASVHGLTVVSWNANVGAGDLDRLVADLRSGRMTEGPGTHFLLLLQEVFSRRESAPIPPGAEVRGPDRIGESSEERARLEIEAVARRWGLHLFYVPSMRNGDSGDGERPEDRGNAILSTLPLSDLQAIELPLQAQRRVVVAATVWMADAEGRPRRLRVVSVHLDHHSEWSRFYRSFGADRARHAALLVDVFREEERIVVAGDINTWFGEDGEPAAEVLRAHFPLPEDRPDGNTLVAALLPDRLVDHLFVRLPPDWTSRYRIGGHTYGSDHRPLVGWVGALEEDRAARPGAGR